MLRIANLSITRQLCCVKPQVRWQQLHTSSVICQKATSSESESPLNRVYYGSLTPNIRSVKVFSLTTSIAGLMAQPLLYKHATELGTSAPLIAAACGFVGFFTFVTPFLLHTVTKKYVTELHHNPVSNEYIATIISFFLTKKKIIFKTNDVEVPEVPGMFTSFLVKKPDNKSTALFVDPKLFEDPTHYVKIMGYDKPIDFKLETNPDKPKE